MQFEEFDKKVKEAAENHHPAYDEQAWRKMENLLNKHMPQEKDERRRFLFILFLFLILGGSGLLIARPWKSRKTIAANEQLVQIKKPGKNLSSSNADKDKSATENSNTLKQDYKSTSSITESVKLHLAPALSKPAGGLSGNVEKSKSNRKPYIQNNPSVVKTKPPLIDANCKWLWIYDSKDMPANELIERTTALNKTNPVNDVVIADKKQDESMIISNPIEMNDVKSVINKPAKNADIKNETLTVKQTTSKKGKNKIKKENIFFFSISTGPDVSFVSNDKLGTAKFFGGAGLGYTFNNRFTLRTGFYSGRKVYTASPAAYHPPDIFYVYYPYLEKVNADCKVYEIPLFISYIFSKSSAKSFFASAGISSYLMKSEKYNYAYKYYPTGPTVNKQWTIKNQNKHLFSGITLSGGYQRNLNKHITMILEPYLKVPLTGIGYGKVKLNSGGILFTIGVSPFK